MCKLPIMKDLHLQSDRVYLWLHFYNVLLRIKVMKFQKYLLHVNLGLHS